MAGSMLLVVIASLSLTMMQIGHTSAQGSCPGPIDIMRVFAVSASTQDYKNPWYIDIALSSIHQLDFDVFYNSTKVLQGNQHPIRMSVSQEGSTFHIYHIYIESKKPMDTSDLEIGVVVQYSCNSILLGVTFKTLLKMFQEEINYPSISEMPKMSNRLDRDEPFTLRMAVSYKNDGKLERHQAKMAFRPIYIWYNTNIMTDRDSANIPRGVRPKKVDVREFNTSSRGFRTEGLTFDAELGDSFPIDGAVLTSPITLRPAAMEGDRGIWISAWTYLQLTDTQVLPMRIESLSSTGEVEPVRIRTEKVFDGELELQTIGLKYSIPEAWRGLRCMAAGMDRRPVVEVAELDWTYVMSIGEITDAARIKQSDAISGYGALGFADFKVDIPLGEEAYYICSASDGGEVTSIVTKVISLVPVAVNAVMNCPLENSDTCRASCSAQGSPSPTLKAYLIPDSAHGTVPPSGSTDEGNTHELTASTGSVNVTTTEEGMAIAFKWPDVVAKYGTYGFDFRCVASNAFEGKADSAYLYSSDYDDY